MRNPLRKRLPRELRTEFGKYLVIFLLMTLSIGFISGFLVAAGSMITAYNDSFEEYNIEDGHFETAKELNRAQRKAVNALGISTWELYYAEEALTNGSTLRVYPVREEIDRICLMQGAMPSAPGEIAIDRMYADNNALRVGDTVSNGSRTWRVTGLVAFSDYSALFSDNSDSMFDAIRFGVGAVTAEEFALYDRDELAWVYAWKYDTPPADDRAEHELSEELMKKLSREVKLTDFVPRYVNQAIIFTGDDMVGDRAMMMTLLYIIIVIMAFVLAVTVGNTIAREAAVIGTLRASGYTRGELTAHYMAMPLLVTLISAAIGNVLGYTVFKNVCVMMYYNSYSLPTYVTLWNAEAFVLTTLVPLALMAAILFFMLRRKLRLPPLKFLRRDLTAGRQRRAVRLDRRLPFMARFRTRVILQNLSSYVILLAGVLFANILLLFGLALPAVLDNYQRNIEQNLLSQYQYILRIPLDAVDEEHKLRSMIRMLRFLDGVETDNATAEKFSVFTLKTTDETYKLEDVMLYGVESGSQYVTLEGAPGRVWVSRAFADKNRLSPGDEIVLKEAYGDETYAFPVDGIYPYDAALTVFMDRAALNEKMGEDADYFCGYFSGTPITDIDEKYIGSVIDVEALTKVSRQLDKSMGSMMYLVDGFSVIIFLVLIYLLSKLIIEKNAQSISMTKILGYTDREIRRLYLLPTSLMVVVFLVGSLPVVNGVMGWLFRFFMMEISGWLPYAVPNTVFAKMLALGLGAYAVVAALEYRRLRAVPMDRALKNVE